MKDNRAEEIIRRKVREQEAGTDLLEAQAALWAALDERLEKKPAPAPKCYYTLWAAASIVFLLVLGFYLYPRQQAYPGRQSALVKPALKGTPARRAAQEVQKKEEKAPQPLTAVCTPARKKKVHPQRSIKVPEHTEVKEEQAPAIDRAGLYAMPQIACAEMPATQYPLCSQTL